MSDLFAVERAPAPPVVVGPATAPVVRVEATVGDGPPRQFLGRVAWALHELVQAGEQGCTPVTHPGPRWSDYVFKLRRDGVNVETVTEMHGGAFSGHHARYRLRSTVVILEVVRAHRRAAA